MLIDMDKNGWYCGEMEGSSTLANNSSIFKDEGMKGNINSSR